MTPRWTRHRCWVVDSFSRKLLQALVIVYATIHGHLPNAKRVGVLLVGESSTSLANLFGRARRMTPFDHIQELYPTVVDARYLFYIASRIMNGEVPRSCIRYNSGESVDLVATAIGDDK